MKNNLFAFLATLLLASPLLAFNTGKSILFADSYMLRAQGVEAAYWNPANLVRQKHIDFWAPGLNMGVSVANNSFDLDTYNFIVGQDYLEDADKQLILNKINGSLHTEMEAQVSLFGFTLDNMSFSSALHAMGKLALSERYLELLLYGNTDSLYVFDKGTTDAKGISYVDFTFGAGGFEIPLLPSEYPVLRTGFSVSALVGVANADLTEFYGYLQSGWDGITLHQDITLRTGFGGYGHKAMLGAACDLSQNLQLGLTLDNLWGKLTWSAVAEELQYSLVADSVYAVDIQDDFYVLRDERVAIADYATELPPEIRMAALWKDNKYSFSADYVQAFKHSAATSKVGRLSFGAQLLPLPFLPLNFGLALGNEAYPWRASYGFGLKSKGSEFGFSVQSIDSIFPGQKSKGVSFGSYIRLWI